MSRSLVLLVALVAGPPLARADAAPQVRAAGFSVDRGAVEARVRPVKAPPKAVPDRVLEVLAHVDRTGEPMDGYEGGRAFGNFERRLPATDDRGRRVRYREWDVNPRRAGVNRGAERLVTGSDGSAYYTADHYATFKKIR